MVDATTPRWTRQPPDVRRRQLLDAAMGVLRHKGFDAMTVAEVAEAAGVGKGTVYLYFDSKNELLVGLQNRYWEEMLEIIGGVLEADVGSHTERLGLLIDDLVDYGAREADRYHALFHDTPTAGGEPVDDFIGLVADLLERGNDSGEFEVEVPAVTAGFLVSAFHGSAATLAHADEATRTQIVPQLKTLFLRAVGA